MVEEAAMEMDVDTEEEKKYHNTTMLLRIYRDVQWHVRHRLNIMQETFLDLGYDDIRQAIAVLADGFDQRLPLSKLEDMVLSMRITDRLIGIIDHALIVLKDYPEHGERYFDIINKMYIIQYKYPEDEIMERLNISRRTLYREKKKAVTLFGSILWGFLIPELMDGTKMARNWHSFATDSGTLT